MITKQYIRSKLETDDRWLERGILAIYNFQTSNEQQTGETIEANSVGFNGSDARLLTYCAKWIARGNHLSGIFLERARKSTLKYAGQLAKIAKDNDKAKQVVRCNEQ